jgi:hypothetical protein
MDELVVNTIGKLYLEIVRLQNIAEKQQIRISELENQVNSTVAPVTKSKNN